MTNKLPTQTFRFDRNLKDKFFPNGESYWDFAKNGIMKSFEICEEHSSEDFEVIIKPKDKIKND